MEKYYLPADVELNIQNSDIIFSKGILNYEKIVIDKVKSSQDFVKSIIELQQNGFTTINNSVSLKDDFITLEEMGYLKVKRERLPKKSILLVVANSEFNYYKRNLKDFHLVKTTDLFSENDLHILLNIGSTSKKEEVFSKISKVNNLKNYKHIFWVDTYYDAQRIRCFNLLLKSLQVPGTIAISDSKMFFLTSIEHGKTGCFECLENQLKTKLKYVSQLYREHKEIRQLDQVDIFLKFGLVINVINELENTGSSSTLGNVIQFNNDNYEYSFTSNRIQSTCSVCSTEAQAFHDEQNVKTIKILNALKE